MGYYLQGKCTKRQGMVSTLDPSWPHGHQFFRTLFKDQWKCTNCGEYWQGSKP